MNKKLIFLTIFSFLVFGLFGLTNLKVAEAQTASFPAGCSSALGYSVTTGSPCNGTSVATPMFMPGCDSALGYSTVNGAPCSGGPVAISWLAGCTSILGYSDITGLPCNGTFVATTSTPGNTPTTPGLPTTGFGGNALINAMILIFSASIASLGFVYIKRQNSSEQAK
ncbi:hypothetical protein IT402_01060 [Candidatus Nomurabacteria bacterium]|nr:hypothetical protein [Candidatus Nomurabacteria bacterium]